MTQIDRYILRMYVRTLLICFSSLAGIFVVIHAFNNLDELAAFGRKQGSISGAMLGYYGPYLLMIFEWTGAILALLALLFTVGWLRRGGELTALLAAGIGHGRILRPMLCAAGIIILLGAISRETLLPHYRDALGARPQDLTGSIERALQPCSDQATGILITGKSLILLEHRIIAPTFHLRLPIEGFGTQLVAESGVWMPASEGRPAGYLLKQVVQPAGIDQLPSGRMGERSVLLTSADTPWVRSGECFVATDVTFDLLRSGTAARQLAGTAELVAQSKNPSVHVSADMRVHLHGRFVRPLLDMSLVLMGLPLAIGRGDRNLFVVAGYGLLLVAGFYFVRSACSTLAAAGYAMSPSIAAWVPLLVFGPIAYARWKDSERR